MSDYFPPLDEMRFVLSTLANISEIATLPGYEEATPDLINAVLEEAGKMASQVLAPLNRIGDQQGSRLIDGQVHTPEGWKAAYHHFVKSGWNGLPFNPEYGGQGLPWTLATPLAEMWHSANMAFALCPMLTQATVEALEKYGSAHLKSIYLPKLVSGEWTGTMNLTEPQAGSDLSAVRSKAIREGDHYRLSGQKIFITYGDHDLAKNIIHFVLAKTQGAPEGTKGISMFLVPKWLVDENGAITTLNDIRCVSLEHKLGIHASPTAVLVYGDQGGAIGYLVGSENKGLAHMFTMMNLARHAVGVEGMAISERAYQQARRYACERIQGKPPGTQTRSAIISHPDIKRMLMQMKSQTEAMRALTYYWAACFDQGSRHPDSKIRCQKLAEAELLTPIVKAWCTEVSLEITSLNIQIHGGMGYIEETGAAQHFRDARITTIYEGTTGIQAGDLIYRKVLHNRGETVFAFLVPIRTTITTLKTITDPLFVDIRKNLEQGVESLTLATECLLENHKNNPHFPSYVSFHYMRIFGIVAGGWLMARAAIEAKKKIENKTDTSGFYNTKIMSTVFFSQQIMPSVSSIEKMITQSVNTPILNLEAKYF